MSDSSSIKGFQGEYRWLSNFWPAIVRFADHDYPTVEHAYQAAKFDDLELRAAIRRCRTPGDAKRMGRTGLIRAGWNEDRIAVMYGLVKQKFEPGTLLAAKLIATGNSMIYEENAWGDKFWGTCNGVGGNNMGWILMHIREELTQ